MKIQTLTDAAVRFFALYLLLSAINAAADLAVSFGFRRSSVREACCTFWHSSW
jgi:hypothetical protein